MSGLFCVLPDFNFINEQMRVSSRPFMPGRELSILDRFYPNVPGGNGAEFRFHIPHLHGAVFDRQEILSAVYPGELFSIGRYFHDELPRRNDPGANILQEVCIHL